METTQNRLSKILARQRHHMVADPLVVIALVLLMLFVAAPMY